MLRNKRTYLIPIIGFAFIILVASIILCLPVCNYKEITFRDALFTATSGLTTTGFTKGPLVEQFNFWGQIILAILMEIVLLFHAYLQLLQILSQHQLHYKNLLYIYQTLQ